MRNFMIGAVMVFSMAMPASAATTRCRDAHGHFIRCPAATAPAHPASNITRDRNGRCHAPGGRFVPCPAAAAAPAPAH